MLLLKPPLLDTNALVHLVREDARGQSLEQKYGVLTGSAAPLICTVTEGEIRSLALQFAWGSVKRQRMALLLGRLVAVPLNHPGLMNAYAVIDAFSKRNGKRMSKNDIWIAAAANATGADLLTTDRDFDHLHPLFLNRILLP